MFFAPPAKVPRTQRHTLNSRTAPFTYKRASELASGLHEAPPTSLEEAVLIDSVNTLTMPAARFLSGAGTHMCWMVDENQKLLRLWSVRRPGWEKAAPRLAEIPCFAAAVDGLPLLVSEMSDEEESLAFCSERGAISSLDHSIEVQMLDAEAGTTASSFLCSRRRIGTKSVLVTVVGTSSGLLVVDVKYEGTHTTVEFNRRDPASFRWMANSHNNLPAASTTPSSPLPAEGDTWAEMENEEEEDVTSVQRSVNASSSSWWSSLKSFVGRSEDSGSVASQDGRRSSTQRAPRPSSWEASAATAAGGEDVWPLSAAGRVSGGAGGGFAAPHAFTHLTFRHHYPEQLVAVNAANEIFLLSFDAILTVEGSGDDSVAGQQQQQQQQPRLCVKWATSLSASLRRQGHVVALAESRHKMCVLYHVAGTPSHPLPALWLVTVDASLGRVVNFVVLNAVAAVVATAARVPSHHIKLFPDDTRCEVLVSIGAYLLRVNNQVGVRQPCSSEDTIHVTHLDQPIASLLLAGGSLVTLDANGPHLTVQDVYATHMSLRGGETAGGRGSDNGECGGEADLKRALDSVRENPSLSLDSAVLYVSEALCAQEGIGEGAGDSGAGNWARRNLNVEDENIVLRVTRQLTARQQAHRRFVVAVLRHGEVRALLSPETLAQLLSAQEALVCLSAVRSLQNVGLQRSGDASEDQAAVQQALPPFTAMLEVMQSGGSYLLQRRPSRHAETETQTPRLVKDAQQLERCQQILRRAIVHVADALRQEEKMRGAYAGRPSTALTAAELCFSNPANLVRLLKTIGEYAIEVRNTVSLSLEDKFAECYAVGCVYVVVAQTIAESREDVGTIYALPKDVQSHLWTSSTDAVSGVELCFSQMCVQLSDMLADLCVGTGGVARGEGNDGLPGLVTLTLQHKCDLLDVVAYLLYFSLTNGTHRDTALVASAITNTILREPFVSGPVGYPHGSPEPSTYCAEIGRRALRLSEQMAIRFDAMGILMAFALATPVDDPAGSAEHYTRLQAYCQRNRRVLDAAMQTLWQQRREWELLSLPVVLPGCADVRERRNGFLAAQAPHLLWLAEPDRYDALNAEGQTCPPYIPYGENQLSHRSRCNAVARLAWVACGAPPSSRFNEVLLSEAIVQAQRDFLAPDLNTVSLGPQGAVQRLLELPSNVAAWVQAAVIASHTMQPTNEDLLVQVLRQCRVHDGEALRDIYTNSVSERETDAKLRQTAVGEVVVTCTKLHDRDFLSRVCETLLSKDELTLLSSWLNYLWSSSYESV